MSPIRTESRPRAMMPATPKDQERLQRTLASMPFAGGTFAPFVTALEAEPLPPINAKGGRDAEGWTAVYEAVVQPDWVNGGGGLHGGAAAWLVDMITGVTLHRLSTPTWNPWGPSINIEMNYYAPAVAGTRLRCEVVVDRMGGSVCSARCVMSDSDTGRRVATGMHTTMRPAKPKAGIPGLKAAL